MTTRQGGSTRYKIADDLKEANHQLSDAIASFMAEGDSLSKLLEDPSVKSMVAVAEGLTRYGRHLLPRMDVEVDPSESMPKPINEGKVTVFPLLHFTPGDRSPVDEKWESEQLIRADPWSEPQDFEPKPFPKTAVGFTQTTLVNLDESPADVRAEPNPLGRSSNVVALVLDGDPKQPLNSRNLNLAHIAVDEGGQIKAYPVPDNIGLTAQAVARAFSYNLRQLSQALDKGLAHAENPEDFKQKLSNLKTENKKI